MGARRFYCLHERGVIKPIRHLDIVQVAKDLDMNARSITALKKAQRRLNTLRHGNIKT
jgi:hypothetical protein